MFWEMPPPKSLSLSVGSLFDPNLFPSHFLMQLYIYIYTYPGSPKPNKVDGLWNDPCKGFPATIGQSFVFWLPEYTSKNEYTHKIHVSIYIYKHNDIYYRYMVCVCVCILQQIFCSNFPAKTGRMEWTGTNLVLQRWGEPHQKPSHGHLV